MRPQGPSSTLKGSIEDLKNKNASKGDLEKMIVLANEIKKEVHQDRAGSDQSNWIEFDSSLDVLCQNLSRLQEILPPENIDNLQSLGEVLAQARADSQNRLFVNVDEIVVRDSQANVKIVVDVTQKQPYKVYYRDSSRDYQTEDFETKEDCLKHLETKGIKASDGVTDIFYIGKASSVGQDFGAFTSQANHQLFVVPSTDPEEMIQMTGRSRVFVKPIYVLPNTPDKNLGSIKTNKELRDALMKNISHGYGFYDDFDTIKGVVLKWVAWMMVYLRNMIKLLMLSLMAEKKTPLALTQPIF